MQTGRIIADRYEVIRQLGRGGMGEVYLAHDQRLAVDVALKRVPLELSIQREVREALIKEARLLARLTHSNVVRLFDLVESEDGVFIVLEYVCGPTLQQVLKQRRTLAPQELLHIMQQVCNGLSYAHSQHIIHRDLKPSNLLLALTDHDRRYFLREGRIPPDLLHAEIKIGDFGIARVVETAHDASGQSSAIVGTPPYMSPEQFRGEVVSAESDIYSLGLIAYECMAGHLPIGDMRPMYFHLMVTPPPLEGCPPAISAAVVRALHKERKDRFPSAQEFSAALDARPSEVPPHQEPNTAAPTLDVATVPPSADGRSTFKLWLALALVVTVFGAVRWGVIPLGRGSREVPTSSAPPSTRALVVGEGTAAPQLPALNVAPLITSLPPVIDNARGAASPGPPFLATPLREPRILRVTALPESETHAFGPDGTLYVLGNGRLVAIKHGEFRWGFELAQDYGGELTIAPDGLMLLTLARGKYAFNAVGQGGVVSGPALNAFDTQVGQLPATRVGAQCLAPDASREQPMLRHAGWQVSLDHSCISEPVVTTERDVVVQTQRRTLYYVSSNGRIRWTFDAPCEFSYIVPMAKGLGVFAVCNDGQRALRVKDGAQQFTWDVKGHIGGSPFSDAEGNIYVANDGQSLSDATLMRLDSVGKVTWTLPIGGFRTASISGAPDGSLLLFGSAMSSSRGYMLTVGESER
jgi:serine/threonine-protein kinase